MKAEHIVDRLMVMFGCDTQKMLAQNLNVTEACISQWRKGVAQVNYHEIIKHAVEKGFNLNWLITGIGEKKISFGRRNKNAQDNAEADALKNELAKQKLQTEKLIEHNEQLLKLNVDLQEQMKKKDKMIERLIEKIGTK